VSSESDIVILFSRQSISNVFIFIVKKIEKSTRELHILNNRRFLISEAV